MASDRQWAGEDSNLRRLSQQIYSLPRLTASVPLRFETTTSAKKGVTTPYPLTFAIESMAPANSKVRVLLGSCYVPASRGSSRRFDLFVRYKFPV